MIYYRIRRWNINPEQIVKFRLDNDEIEWQQNYHPKKFSVDSLLFSLIPEAYSLSFFSLREKKIGSASPDNYLYLPDAVWSLASRGRKVASFYDANLYEVPFRVLLSAAAEMKRFTYYKPATVKLLVDPIGNEIPFPVERFMLNIVSQY